MGLGPATYSLLGNCGFLKPNVLLDARVKQLNAQLLLHVHFVPLGLDTDLGDILVLRNHVHPGAVAFFGHDGRCL